jgi:hypothetical protein
LEFAAFVMDAFGDNCSEIAVLEIASSEITALKIAAMEIPSSENCFENCSYGDT